MNAANELDCVAEKKRFLGLARCLPNPGRIRSNASGKAEKPFHEVFPLGPSSGSNCLFILGTYPICQTGNTDRSGTFGWEFPISDLGEQAGRPRRRIVRHDSGGSSCAGHRRGAAF